MNCPYCGKEMKPGVIYGARYSLKWIPENKYKRSLVQWFSGGIKLQGLYEDSLEAFCCKNCKKIIIDIENKID